MHDISPKSRESGFTLVELAIVMLIIGLLVGGVLKGQEMLSSARLSSTIQAMDSYSAATNTFEGQYGGAPGDLEDPESRIAGCSTAACGDGSATGTGDGHIEQAAGVSTNPTEENGLYWIQLSAADLADLGEQEAPAADLGGFFNIGYHIPGGSPAISNAVVSSGSLSQFHYFTIVNEVTQDQSNSGAPPFTAETVSKIDRKMDDGNPNTGSLHAAGNDSCTDGDVYDAAGYNTANCSFYVKAFR